MTSLYRLLSVLLLPVLLCWLCLRAAKGKEVMGRLRERFGIASLKRPQGTLMWVHAASVGELNAALPLVMKMRETMKDVSVLITTGTVTSAHQAEKVTGSHIIHQFVPVDSVVCVRNFLRHWKPDIAVWMESELWPNLVMQSHRQHIPMMLINARISERSVRKWQRMHRLFLRMIRCFNTVMTASPSDAERFGRLGVTWIVQQNNIKYDAPPLEVHADFAQRLQDIMGSRPRWLAASTHEGEEATVLEAHSYLKKHHPSILTMIVPRHPVRGESVQSLCNAMGVRAARISQQDHIPFDCEVLIGDVMGEMGAFFSASRVVLMGGTMVEQGGHNPIEPAQLGCAIMAGPYMFHFANMADEWTQNSALKRVENARNIADTVSEWLNNEPLRSTWANAAAEMVASHKGGIADLLHAIYQTLANAQQGKPI